jgi:hypothetical protein
MIKIGGTITFNPRSPLVISKVAHIINVSNDMADMIKNCNTCGFIVIKVYLSVKEWIVKMVWLDHS